MTKRFTVLIVSDSVLVLFVTKSNMSNLLNYLLESRYSVIMPCIMVTTIDLHVYIESNEDKVRGTSCVLPCSQSAWQTYDMPLDNISVFYNLPTKLR